MKIAEPNGLLLEHLKAMGVSHARDLEFDDAEVRDRVKRAAKHHPEESEPEIEARVIARMACRQHGIVNLESVPIVKRETAFNQEHLRQNREHQYALEKHQQALAENLPKNTDAILKSSEAVRQAIILSTAETCSELVKLEEAVGISGKSFSSATTGVASVIAEAFRGIERLHDENVKRQSELLAAVTAIAKRAMWLAGGYLLVILGILIALLVFSVKAHAQVDVIQWMNSSNVLVKSYAAPFKVKEGSNITFSIGACPGPTCNWLVITGSGAAGTVTSVSGLVPLFTVSNPTTTPTFALSNAAAHTVFGNNTAGSAAPAYFVPACDDLSNGATGCSTTVGAAATHGASTTVNGQTCTLDGSCTVTATPSGVVSLALGGTSAALTADLGGIFYSTATAGAILASTATANKILLSGASAAPVWSTPTFPNASATAGKYIKSDGTNWIASTGSASGTGSCTNQAVTATSSDAAPTCTTLTSAYVDTSVLTTSTTATGIEAPLFCTDAGANDTYACNLSPAIASYVTGTHYRFKANTANTGAASINFNSKGALTIKKAAGGITTDLADNDIRAGQWVDVVYDGTNAQMQSTLGNAAAGSGTVTSIATTSPITGGTIMTTGTIACATCVTSAAALTSNAVVIGGGLQASSTISADTTTTHALYATAGAPAFRATTAADLPSGSGKVLLNSQAANASISLATNTDNTVCSYTLPGNTIGTNQGVEFCIAWQSSAGISLSSKMFFGATSSNNSSSSTGELRSCWRFVNGAATNAQDNYNIVPDTQFYSSLGTYFSSAIDTTANVVIKFTLNPGATSGKTVNLRSCQTTVLQ